MRALGAIWHGCLNNNFQCLNNNNTFDTYFYNTQTRISTTLKIEQPHLNTATKWTLNPLTIGVLQSQRLIHSFKHTFNTLSVLNESINAI